MRFSKRAGFDPTPHALARAAAANAPTWDLTISNPTQAGFSFDERALHEAIGSVRARSYDPAPRGIAAARHELAVALGWRAEHLVLTATTSEAYSFLIKLFCDPGDAVLIPEPGYPLLRMLAQLEGVVPEPYGLRYDGEWHVDPAALEERLDASVKLIFAVSPNNPTGAYLTDDDLERLLDFGVPVVVDEVFASYDLRREHPSSLRHTKTESGLLFALGGLSKAAALPQLKLSWMALSGDEALLERALAQLDLITDAYLSTNEVTQRALSSLLSLAHDRRRLVFDRLRQNRRSALRLAQDVAEISALPVQGGWYQVLRLPHVMSEEQWALGFLDRGVLVQPGWFYDFSDEPWAVVSLLTPTEVFSEGLGRIGQTVVDATSP